MGREGSKMLGPGPRVKTCGKNDDMPPKTCSSFLKNGPIFNIPKVPES